MSSIIKLIKMSDFCYVLFNEVFIEYDVNKKFSIDPNFEYEGKNFAYIKQNYRDYDIQDLLNILYLYSIKMSYFDYSIFYDKSKPLYFKHKGNVESVIRFIDGELDDVSDSGDDSDDDSDDEPDENEDQS